VRQGKDALDREMVALIGDRSRYVEAAAKVKADEAGVRAPERRRAMLESATENRMISAPEKAVVK
jgi:isochorismate pyruvate lyase